MQRDDTNAGIKGTMYFHLLLKTEGSSDHLLTSRNSIIQMLVKLDEV